MPKIIAIGHLC